MRPTDYDIYQEMNNLGIKWRTTQGFPVVFPHKLGQTKLSRSYRGVIRRSRAFVKT